MKLTGKPNKLLIIIFIVVAVGSAAYFYFSNSGSVPAIVSSSDQGPVGEDILVLVNKLKAVSIDNQVFTSAIFLSLVDREAQIQPEAQGRIDPFAKIGLESAK